MASSVISLPSVMVYWFMSRAGVAFVKPCRAISSPQPTQVMRASTSVLFQVAAQ